MVQTWAVWVNRIEFVSMLDGMDRLTWPSEKVGSGKFGTPVGTHAGGVGEESVCLRTAAGRGAGGVGTAGRWGFPGCVSPRSRTPPHPTRRLPAQPVSRSLCARLPAQRRSCALDVHVFAFHGLSRAVGTAAACPTVGRSAVGEQMSPGVETRRRGVSRDQARRGRRTVASATAGRVGIGASCCRHTPGRVTAPLPAMLHGCHAANTRTTPFRHPNEQVFPSQADVRPFSCASWRSRRLCDAVTNVGDGFDCWGFSEFASQPADRNLDDVGERVDVLVPHLVEEVFGAEDRLWAPHEYFEHGELFG